MVNVDDDATEGTKLIHTHNITNMTEQEVVHGLPVVVLKAISDTMSYII